MSSPTDENHTDGSPQAQDADPISELYKYLLLLANMVATVTCTAGLDPPGGLWVESKDGHLTGDPIMHDTGRSRYMVFYIFNILAFAVSLVLVVNLLMSAPRNMVPPHLPLRRCVVLKFVVVVNLMLLVVAFIAGSCRGRLITIYASVHCSAVVVIIVPILVHFSRKLTNKNQDDAEQAAQSRKVLMLLSIFATTVTYTASLSPPGGFWEHAPTTGNPKHRAGDPILLERDLGRMVVFYVGNTTAFITSVVIMMLLLFLKLTKIFMQFCACIMLGMVMVGLAAAYTASVWRHPKTTDTIITIVSFIVGDIFLYYVFYLVFGRRKTDDGRSSSPVGSSAAADGTGPRGVTSTESRDGQTGVGASPTDDTPSSEKSARELILLLAAMVATVTYQAGLQPPGGVWRGNGQGHSGGGLILLVTHAARYKAFFFLNTAAFVTSIVVVIMVQRRPQVTLHTLEAAVILDMLGLLGAYAAGTIRGHHAWSFACVAILAAVGVIFLLLVATLVHQNWFQAPLLVGQDQHAQARSNNTRHEDTTEDRSKEKRRELLMLLATMAITITYQAGLTPPGKFWLEDGEHHAGDPVLVDTYPHLYKWFLFSNTSTFMISVAVILFLVSRKLSSVGKIWWRILPGYTFLLLVLLMTTFIAGANRRPPKATFSAIVIAATLIFQAATLTTAFWEDKVHFFKEVGRWFFPKPDNRHFLREPASAREREYLAGVSILAASVAYQAGLSPPGGSWPDDGHGHAAGNPVLYDMDRRRYLAFYYCNTASFAASIAVNVLLLLDVLVPKKHYFFQRWARATYMVLVLDVLALLMAYAIGSSRDKGTWMYVLAAATAMLTYVAIYMVLPPHDDNPSTSATTQGEQQRPSDEQTLA